jgi:hypothetical protein
MFSWQACAGNEQVQVALCKWNVVVVVCNLQARYFLPLDTSQISGRRCFDMLRYDGSLKT